MRVVGGGDVTRENALEIVRQVDEIFIQSIKRAGLYDEIWQALISRDLGFEISWSSRDQRTHSQVAGLSQGCD